MVVGVLVYKFELNLDETGEIEPQFRIVSSEITEEFKDIKIFEILSMNDLFTIYYNHTAGSRTGFQVDKKGISRNFFMGKLKEAPYKVISYFRESIDESHFLTIIVFKMDEDYEIFEEIIQILAGKMDIIFEKMAKGNLRSVSFLRSIEEDIKAAIKFTIFQIDRLTNLTKVQKVGLIYMGPERAKTLELLRKGPISYTSLQYELSKIKENPNINQVLRPFTELNLIRRDWAKGIKDKRSGLVWGQGEYIFLVKDVVLIRTPPKAIIEQMKKNTQYGQEYLNVLENFYSNYAPHLNYQEESKLLSNFLLNSDIYDLLALLSHSTYATEKMPHVMSEFSDAKKVIEQLADAKLVALIKDATGREWVCLLGEIVPVVMFPEYMIPNIQERLLKKDESLAENPEKDPITVEVAKRALELLETSYSEKIEF